MRRIGIVFFLASLTAGPVVASDRDDVIVALAHADVDFNKFDRQAIMASCSDVVSILDDIPPHEWHGIGACAKWLDDNASFNKANGITEFHETLGKPLHVDITGDVAYVVYRAQFTWTMKGEKASLSDCRWTVVLRKGSNGWRMTSWAFSDGIKSAAKAGAQK